MKKEGKINYSEISARGRKKSRDFLFHGVKVYVMMSGGVDSSVAAGLLKKEGYDVTGVHMVCWQGKSCTASDDLKDAERAAAVLDIPFLVWDLKKEYKRKVFDYMVSGYKSGITPNPDVMCNKEIKFGEFFKKARREGAEFVATGHYVCLRRKIIIVKKQIVNNKKEVFQLLEAKDKNKDQSYFLWGIKPEYLKHCLFPVGGYLKSEIREMAKKMGLKNADKKDSQGLCFVGKVNFQKFLGKQIKVKKGPVVNMEGKITGEHKGVDFYTIGQRHGIGIFGGGKSYFVYKKDKKKNILFVAPENDRRLFAKEAILGKVNIFGDKEEVKRQEKGVEVLARVRYRQLKVSAIVLKGKGRWVLKFKKPIKFLAPGQSAVWYGKSGKMMGGGVIKKKI